MMHANCFIPAVWALAASILVAAAAAAEPCPLPGKPDLSLAPQRLPSLEAISSLARGGFRLWMDDAPIPIDPPNEEDGPVSITIVPAQRNVTFRLDRPNLDFDAIFIRLEAGHDQEHGALSTLVGLNSNLQLHAQQCGRDTQAFRGFLSTTEKQQSFSQFQVLVNEDNARLPLDITVAVRNNDNRTTALFHSRFLLETSESDREAVFPEQTQRLLNDNETSTILSDSPSDVPSTIPTESPSGSPSDSPSDVPSFVPTESPSGSPSDSPSDVPSLTPTTKPSSFPSLQPSLKPSLTPSISKSFQPSQRPSATPSTQPSIKKVVAGQPTMSPTNQPTTQSPVTMPPTPTGAPATSLPTRAGTIVTETINGAEIFLQSVGTLDRAAQISFEGSLDGWYEVVYPETRRFLRSLQVAGVADVTTSTVFVDQRPTASGNTIIYNQAVSYIKFDQGLTTSSVLTEPFEVSELNQQLRARLRASHPTFESLLDESIQTPLVQDTSGDDDELGGAFSIGIVIGIAVAGVAVVALAVFLLVRSSRRDGKTESGGRTEEVLEEKMERGRGAKSIDADDDGPPPASADGSNPNAATPENASFKYSDRSVTTEDYEYSKVYGGAGQSVSSQDRSVKDGGLLGSPPTESQNEGLVLKEKIFDVKAPSGKLGVVIDTPDAGPPIVHAVKDSSVLVDQVQVGDKLLAVDDEDVTMMTAVRVSKMISEKSGNAVRKFTMMRRIVVEEN